MTCHKEAQGGAKRDFSPAKFRWPSGPMRHRHQVVPSASSALSAGHSPLCFLRLFVANP